MSFDANLQKKYPKYANIPKKIITFAAQQIQDL
jgi:hypothetical protein